MCQRNHWIFVAAGSFDMAVNIVQISKKTVILALSV